MKRIALATRKNQKQRVFALVDDGDYSLLTQYVWHLRKGHRTDYAERYEDGNMIGMHNQIMNVATGIDHKNRDGLDNQRHNLRIASKSQNAHNRRSWSRCGYKGVSRTKRGYKQWAARITVNGKTIGLGYYFLSAEAAAIAYDRAALKYFGSFASLNFPERHGTSLS